MDISSFDLSWKPKGKS